MSALLPRIKNDLPHITLVKGTVTFYSLVKAHNLFNQTRWLSHSTKDVLALDCGLSVTGFYHRHTRTKKIECGREHCAGRATSKVQRDVLVVALRSCQRERRGSVHTNGCDYAERLNKVIRQAKSTRVSDNLERISRVRSKINY